MNSRAEVVSSRVDESLAARVSGLLAADPDLMADPYPTWNELRSRHPVWRLSGTVILSRHHDVGELLADNNVLYSRARTRHSARYEEGRSRFTPEDRAAFDTVLDNEFRQLVRLDPPDHPRLRRVVTPPFSVRRLASEMEQKVQARLDKLLDELSSGNDAIDFKRFAYTLPLEVLGDLLGIPLTDLDLVHSWAHKIAANKLNADSGTMAREADAAYQGLNRYIDELVARQRDSGTATGLVGALVDAERNNHITYDELAAMIALMIFAGHETTSNLLAIGMMALLKHPEQWNALCADPSLAPQATEELLRFVTPAHFLQYVAIQGRQLDGLTIEEGDTVIGVLAAANRDPDVFTDPDVLDISRTDSKNHLALGFGPHFCLGAALARMEASLLFRTMAERFPKTELATQVVQWGGSGSLRTPLTLPMRLQA